MFVPGDHGLKRSDRTGTERAGAGVAVEHRQADRFAVTGKDLSFYESDQVSVEQSRRKDLYP
ncbi:hypothetical protein SDC9_120762 [bioreactor metagenome]|uniref:Uncharacterized protein n=1 Tax=bioreactor metagenome TaxID=1076179 RepID=A0A645CA24_9ZZZZ